MAPDADKTHRRQGTLTLYDVTTTTTTQGDRGAEEGFELEHVARLPHKHNGSSSSSSLTTSSSGTCSLEDDDGSSCCSYYCGEQSAMNSASLECVLQPRFVADFSHMEKPIRFTLACQGKQLATNGKSALFMTRTSGSSNTTTTTTATVDEFTLLPQTNGTVQLQSIKTKRFLCSNPSNGRVYASETCYEGMEQWTLASSRRGGGEGGTLFKLVSVASQGRRYLACDGNTVCTIAIDNDKSDNSSDLLLVDSPKILWTVNFTTGELCFLSLSSNNNNNNNNNNQDDKLQMRCDMLGKLTMSKHYQGWAAWRLSEVPSYRHPGCVRISSWAHSDYYLACNKQGEVFTTSTTTTNSTSTDTNDEDTLWSVERAPNGLDGVLLKSRANGQVLQYHPESKSFGTIPGDAANAYLLDESCVWDLESVHRQTYYLVTTPNSNSSTSMLSSFSKRLEAAKRGLTTRGLPGRLSSEEWKIQSTNDYGVVTLFSNGRQQYLASNSSGDAFLMESCNDDSCKWRIEDRGDAGFVVQAYATERVLVAPDRGNICTIVAGTTICGNTRWKLEPKLPPQVNKQKMQAVGAAVAIGVVGTVATPFVIGGAIGMMGIAEVGVAGHVAIGSIRAAEALNTITRVTLSSSQLMISQSSFLEASSGSRHYNDDKSSSSNRPFCAWRTW